MNLRQAIDDPREFITRLHILTKRNALRPFYPLWPETEVFLRELLGSKQYILAVKPRQVAFTTVTTAYEFWKGYTSGTAHRCIQVVHEREAMIRLMEMVQIFHDSLPKVMQRGLSQHNEKRTRYAHNKAGFNRVLAGGRGQARSWSFNDAHFTEMAFYPAATASSGQDAAGTTAEGMWQSALATLEESDEAKRIVVESTGNGPRGLFYKLWKQARNDPSWAYVFVPWTSVARYCHPMTPEQEAAFMATADADELRLAGAPTFLSPGQLSWRRERMVTQAWTPARFAREFPQTDMEPFLAGISGWFDAERLNEMLSWCRHLLARDRAELRVFHEWERGRRYFMGVDTASGVGRDYACIQVLRDDGLQVAIWATNTARPREIAEWVSRLGMRYGGATELPPLAVIEANNDGRSVLERLRSMGDAKGVELWRDPDTGDDFWSTAAAGGGGRKRDAMVLARELIEDGRVIIECVWTLLQLLGIVEKWNGKIEAKQEFGVELEDKDDYAMALVFALWGMRRHLAPRSIESLEEERARIASRIRSLYDDRRGGGGYHDHAR